MNLNWKKWMGSLPTLFTLGLVLPIMSIWSIHSRKVDSRNLECNVRQLHAKLVKLQTEKIREKNILSRMKNAPPNYFQEMDPFCQAEIKKLHTLVNTSPQDERARERLAFLTHGNRIELSTGNDQGELVLRQPVELDETDLTRLLCWIEQVPVGTHYPPSKAPYFTVKQFELSKNPISTQEETFLVNLSLVKHGIPHE